MPVGNSLLNLFLSGRISVIVLCNIASRQSQLTRWRAVVSIQRDNIPTETDVSYSTNITTQQFSKQYIEFVCKTNNNKKKPGKMVAFNGKLFSSRNKTVGFKIAERPC
uniref:Uncharacterized protein n=1 Tax=Cacopsylla melanoneura TaxID=428564 RepID=A0A8D9BLK3_9HEMI